MNIQTENLLFEIGRLAESLVYGLLYVSGVERTVAVEQTSDVVGPHYA
jgi:hypothetical protein